MSVLAVAFFVLVTFLVLAMIDPLVGLAVVRMIDALERKRRHGK